MMRIKLFLLAMFGLPAEGLAADVTLSFMLANDPANLVDCLSWGPAFERPYTLVASDGRATLTSGGGVHVAMESAGSDTYRGVFDLSGERLNFTADVAAKTLSASENNLGCKWTAKAQ
jgi:hypothetical protein